MDLNMPIHQKLVPYLVHAVPPPHIEASIILARKCDIRLRSSANCKEPHKAWCSAWGRSMRFEWMGGGVAPVATAVTAVG